MFQKSHVHWLIESQYHHSINTIMQLSINDMHILANRPKVYIEFRFIFCSDFVTLWGVTRGKVLLDERWQSVTWVGVKSKWHIFWCHSDILFEWPYVVIRQSSHVSLQVQPWPPYNCTASKSWTSCIKKINRMISCLDLRIDLSLFFYR